MKNMRDSSASMVWLDSESHVGGKPLKRFIYAALSPSHG